MKNNSNIFERILQISNEKGFKSVNDFAVNGLKYASSEKLNRLKKEGAKPSFDIIEDITIMFEDIDANWLITGKGNIFKASQESFELRKVHQAKSFEKNYDNQAIPLYGMEASASIVTLFSDYTLFEPIDTISIPNLPKCDGAIYVTGDSMYPLLKSGDVVVFKQVSNTLQDIYYGEMYLISVSYDNDYYTTVKFIQKSDLGNDYVKLVSQNQHHQPKDIPISSIKALALIKASIRINSM